MELNVFSSIMQEVEQLRQEKLEIDQQLRAIHGSSIGSVQNFPVQRRSDRGYSSDIDSMRSNRGGGNQSNQGSGGLRGRGGRGGRGNNPRYHPGNNSHRNNDSNRFDNVVEQPVTSARPTYRPRAATRGNRRGSYTSRRTQSPPPAHGNDSRNADDDK